MIYGASFEIVKWHIGKERKDISRNLDLIAEAGTLERLMRVTQEAEGDVETEF